MQDSETQVLSDSLQILNNLKKTKTKTNTNSIKQIMLCYVRNQTIYKTINYTKFAQNTPQISILIKKKKTYKFRSYTFDHEE